jgi:hypothetical protein
MKYLLRNSKRILNLGLVAMLLAVVVMPVLPEREAQAAPTYPNLPEGLNYYQVTYPAGLRYSGLDETNAWYGTFTSAPKPAAIFLYDDDWTEEFGRLIVAFQPAPKKQPSGEQGGTTLTAITRDQADAIIKSYSLNTVAKPFDSEIEDVMLSDHYFVGAWAGEKLTQKWNYGSAEERAPPAELQTERQKQYVADTYDKEVKNVDLEKYDPDRFWVNGSGNWSDTTHWANASGNTSGGASVPTNADNAFFDANSFNGTGQTVTVDVVANTLAMDWTGATNTPTLAGAEDILAYANVTFIAGMVSSWNGVLHTKGSNTIYINTNGLSLANGFQFVDSQSWLTYLSSNITTTGDINLARRKLYTQGFTVTGGAFISGGAFANTLSAANSTFNVTSWTITNNNYAVWNLTDSIINISGTGVFAALSYAYATVNLTGTEHTVSGTGTIDSLNLGSAIINTSDWLLNITTLNAGTSTINVIGTGAFAGGDITTYNIVNLIGSAHTISGSNTFGTLSGNSSVTQTLTFAGGSSVTATSFDLGGSSGFQHTLTSSNTTPWQISQLAGDVTADYITVSYSTANTSGGQTYTATGGSVDGGNNTGWTFPLTIATNAAIPTMDKDGVTGNFSGTTTDMGGSATVDVWHEYGLTPAYGSTTSNVTYSTTNFTGTKLQAMPSSLTPGETYHTRFAITSGANTTYGSDETFTLTTPTVTTVSGTLTGGQLTMEGNATDKGVADDFYAGFLYSWSGGNSTAAHAVSSTGAFTETVTISNSLVTITAYARVGSVYSYGSTIAVDRYDKFPGLRDIMGVFGMLTFLTLMGSATSGILAATIVAVRMLRSGF